MAQVRSTTRPRWPERMDSARVHLAVNTQAPQTLAYALEDSPVGLLAWLVERRRAWSDCGGDIEAAFSKDFLLTNASIYWFTRTIGTSMRYYAERTPFVPVHDRVPIIEAPTAVALALGDVVLMPRGYAERHSNLQKLDRAGPRRSLCASRTTSSRRRRGHPPILP